MPSQSRNWTLFGLVLALFGLPAIVAVYNWRVAMPSDAAIAVREIAILALTAFLLWIVIKRERLPLTSIGLSFDRPGRALARGLALLVVIFAVLVGILVVYGALGRQTYLLVHAAIAVGFLLWIRREDRWRTLRLEVNSSVDGSAATEEAEELEGEGDEEMRDDNIK